MSVREHAPAPTSGTGMDTGEAIARDATPSGAASSSRPELKDGIGGTLALAVLATLGRIVVPIAVQQTLDKGVNAPGGPDVALHRVVDGLVAAVAVVVTGLASYLMT